MAAYTGAPGCGGRAVLLALAPVVQPQFVGFALARRLAGRTDAGFWRTTVVGACAYVGAEWLCPKLFADTIGHGVYASPLAAAGRRPRRARPV